MSSIEGELQIPQDIRNDVKVIVGNKQFVYHVLAHNIRVKDLSIHAYVRVTKARQNVQHIVRRRVSWFPLRFEEQVINEEQILWDVWVRRESGYWADVTIIYSCEIYERHGPNPYGARGGILSELAKSGILIPRELADAWFQPIEEQLVALMKKITNYGGKPKAEE